MESSNNEDPLEAEFAGFQLGRNGQLFGSTAVEAAPRVYSAFNGLYKPQYPAVNLKECQAHAVLLTEFVMFLQ
ncbi:hypothetical protein FRC09_006837, partial [Ceratobasidium sp. 395]